MFRHFRGTDAARSSERSSVLRWKRIRRAGRGLSMWLCPERQRVRTARPAVKRGRSNTTGSLGRYVLVGVIVALVAVAASQYFRRPAPFRTFAPAAVTPAPTPAQQPAPTPTIAPAATAAPAPAPAPASGATVAPPSSATIPATQGAGFRCDGRTHCSQMTSCEEAKYFLNNCPGAAMDGNGDGVPCERQWCSQGR